MFNKTNIPTKPLKNQQELKSSDVQQNNHSNKTIKNQRELKSSDVQQNNHSNKTKQKPSRTQMFNKKTIRTKPNKNHRELIC